MQVFKVQTPDGRVMRVPAPNPQAATRAAAAVDAARGRSGPTFGSLARQAAQGLVDGVDGAANSVLSMTPGGFAAKQGKFALDSVNNIADLIRAGVGPARAPIPKADDLTRPFLDFALGRNPLLPAVPTVADAPRNEPERLARAVGTMAPNAFTGPGGLVRRAAQVAVPAAASEGARYLAQRAGGGPTAQAAAQILGGGAGGAMVGGGATAIRPRATAAPEPAPTPRSLESAPEPAAREAAKPAPLHPAIAASRVWDQVNSDFNPYDEEDPDTSLWEPFDPAAIANREARPPPDLRSLPKPEELVRYPDTSTIGPDEPFNRRYLLRRHAMADLPDDTRDQFFSDADNIILGPFVDDPDVRDYTPESADEIHAGLADLADRYRQQGGVGARLADQVDGVNEDFKAMIARRPWGGGGEAAGEAQTATPEPASPVADVTDLSQRMAPSAPPSRVSTAKRDQAMMDIMALLPPTGDPERPNVLAGLKMVLTAANDNAPTRFKPNAPSRLAAFYRPWKPVVPPAAIWNPPDASDWMATAANDNFPPAAAAAAADPGPDPAAANAFTGANTGSNLAAAIAARTPRSITSANLTALGGNAMIPAGLAAAGAQAQAWPQDQN